MPEYVAGLQYDTVLLIDVNRGEVPDGPYSLAALRKFASQVYQRKPCGTPSGNLFVFRTWGDGTAVVGRRGGWHHHNHRATRSRLITSGPCAQQLHHQPFDLAAEELGFPALLLVWIDHGADEDWGPIPEGRRVPSMPSRQPGIHLIVWRLAGIPSELIAAAAHSASGRCAARALRVRSD